MDHLSWRTDHLDSDAGIELSLAPIQELFSRKAKKTDASPDAEEVAIDKTE